MEIMVSILTTAYNHAPFIAQALDSFLAQKTNFPFEVIVHDDASTDGTDDIIRHYAEKYPDIVKPIFQKVNQYSQGINVYSFMKSAARGKYFALCEGDDYWCDEHKLQIQVDWLEKHPEYCACVHNTRKINLKTGSDIVWYSTERDTDLYFEQILKGGSVCFHTSSIMWRQNIQIYNEMREIKSYGDYVLALSLALQGKIRYFSRVMSVYRYFTPDSWSMRQSVSAQARIRRHQDNLRLMEIVNDLTNRKYCRITDEIIKKQKFCILEESGHYQELKEGELKTLYQKLTVWRRLNIFVKQYMPGMFRVYKKLSKILFFSER